jgi:hypothetical protein
MVRAISPASFPLALQQRQSHKLYPLRGCASGQPLRDMARNNPQLLSSAA